ncbi:MAG: hypothetical protein F6K41_06015 [Symploca sp. SIO3E6]|nr:hypothetical protein [Caldora sp. SIO3E6]
MSIVVIGDQGVGKTTLMLELARPSNGNVQVSYPSFAQLKNDFMINNQIVPTDNVYNTALKVKVNLPSYFKEFDVNWVDTAGEAWKPYSQWQIDHPSEWADTLESLRTSQGLMLIMAPHRSLLREDLLEKSPEQIAINDSRFRTKKQWQERFKEWIAFFELNCSKVNQILICLNMADLFCDIDTTATNLKQDYLYSNFKWYNYKEKILLNFFSDVIDIIDKYDYNRHLPIQLFVTTYRNRTLLEIPWIYLGGYL